MWSSVWSLREIKKTAVFLQSREVGEKKVRWPPYFYTAAHKQAGVYVMFSKTGEVMYIGKTRNILQRTYMHLFSTQVDNLRKRFNPGYWYMMWKMYPTHTPDWLLVMHESILIEYWKPKHNIRGLPSKKLSSP